MKISNALGFLIVFIGLYNLISPFTLGTSNLTFVDISSAVTGVALMWLGLFGITATTTKAERKVNRNTIGIALWLILTPIIFGLAQGAGMSPAILNSLIVGAVVLVIELIAAYMAHTPLAHPQEPGDPASEITLPIENGHLPVKTYIRPGYEKKSGGVS